MDATDEALEARGYSLAATAFVACHTDRKHPHVHIVDLSGST